MVRWVGEGKYKVVTQERGINYLLNMEEELRVTVGHKLCIRHSVEKVFTLLESLLNFHKVDLSHGR